MKPWNDAAWTRHLALIRQVSTYLGEQDIQIYFRNDGQITVLNKTTAQEFTQPVTEEQVLELQYGDVLICDIDFLQWPEWMKPKPYGRRHAMAALNS